MYYNKMNEICLNQPLQDWSGKEHTVLVPVGFSRSLASREITEETHQILEQIQNHIDSQQPVMGPDGQPIEVSNNICIVLGMQTGSVILHQLACN